MQQSVSIVIPTLNRRECLINTVRDLLEQDYSDFEIIIVDQSEEKDDGLLTFLKTQPTNHEVRYFHVNFRGLPQARNFGWQVSRHGLIIFVDDDVIIPNNFITEHLNSYIEPRVGIVAGGIFEVYRKDNPNPVKPGSFNYWTATPSRDFNSSKPGYIYSVGGGNFSVQKKVFQKASGFDETLSLGAALYEETEFCLRAMRWGYKVWFNPKPFLKHLAYPTGGCRVEEVPNYIWSLARNRMIVIMRNLRWYHLPTAMLRLLLLILSYTRSSRNIDTLFSGLSGLREGFRLHSGPPLVSPENLNKIKFEIEFSR